MMIENSVAVCVKNTQTGEEVSSNTLDTTKISDFFNLLTSSEFIVVELIVPNHIFIDLNIFYSNITNSITTRFGYDLLNLSPNYFGSEAVLISLIEERGTEIFYNELCRNEKKFMQIFNSNDLSIQDGYVVLSKDNNLIIPALKINYFFDSDQGEFILDYSIQNSNIDITIKDLNEKAIKVNVILNEIINKITNENFNG